MKNISKHILAAFFLSLTLATVLHLANHYLGFQMPEWFLLVIRWIPLVCYFLFAIKKKKLTTWIFMSMLMGVEFGYDMPFVAKELNIVSQIFIHLVKTIIAPRIFATLVTGIAGHANLKQVGRMGWKSLLY
ncbi:MAG: cation:dicarboxylase symporter family transporter, partial [Bacteroidetes bacterium]|nr:cation:dicarboxylase symporter family transporter [Bacteroidota bacterium]